MKWSKKLEFYWKKKTCNVETGSSRFWAGGMRRDARRRADNAALSTTCNVETGSSRFWAGGMRSGGSWLSPIWVWSRRRVRIAPPRLRCTHMLDVSSNHEWWELYFPDGWLGENVDVIATSVNLNNGELVEGSSIGTVACQQNDELRSIYWSTIVVEHLEWPCLCEVFQCWGSARASCIAVLVLRQNFICLSWEESQQHQVLMWVLCSPWMIQSSVKLSALRANLSFSGCFAVCAPSILKRETKKKCNNFKW